MASTRFCLLRKWFIKHWIRDDDGDDDELLCGIVDRRRTFSLISSRDDCQRSLPSRISDTSLAGFELAQNLSSRLSWMKLCSVDNHCIATWINKNKPIENMKINFHKFLFRIKKKNSKEAAAVALERFSWENPNRFILNKLNKPPLETRLHANKY